MSIDCHKLPAFARFVIQVLGFTFMHTFNEIALRQIEKEARQASGQKAQARFLWPVVRSWMRSRASPLLLNVCWALLAFFLHL